MLSPLHILIALWYHTRGSGQDYEAGTSHGESQAVQECCAELVAAGLLKESFGASAIRRKYEPTEGLHVWVESLTEVEFPVLRWVPTTTNKAGQKLL